MTEIGGEEKKKEGDKKSKCICAQYFARRCTLSRELSSVSSRECRVPLVDVSFVATSNST